MSYKHSSDPPSSEEQLKLQKSLKKHRDYTNYSAGPIWIRSVLAGTTGSPATDVNGLSEDRGAPHLSGPWLHPTGPQHKNKSKLPEP